MKSGIFVYAYKNNTRGAKIVDFYYLIAYHYKE